MIITDKKPKSFILYTDFESVLLHLSIKERGMLFTMIYSYVNRGTIEAHGSITPLVDMAFEIVRAQLDRDREKYEQKCQKNSENGRLGGRPSNQTENRTVYEKSERFSKKPKKPYNDNDNNNKNDNDNYTDTDNDSELKIGRSFDAEDFFAAAVKRSLEEI